MTFEGLKSLLFLFDDGYGVFYFEESVALYRQKKGAAPSKKDVVPDFIIKHLQKRFGIYL